MSSNRRRFPAPVALLLEHKPRRDAAVITALRPQVLPHIIARFLETEQSACQGARRGTTEQVAPRFIPCGHRAEYRLSVGHSKKRSLPCVSWRAGSRPSPP